MLALYGDNGKENGNYHFILELNRGYEGIMEKNMEAIGIMGII